MSEIQIKKEKRTETGWEFEVEVEGDRFNVSLDKEHWHQLTGGGMNQSELIRKSFEFLLEREPKESILKSFNLRITGKYFPEYEEVIKKMIQD